MSSGALSSSLSLWPLKSSIFSGCRSLIKSFSSRFSGIPNDSLQHSLRSKKTKDRMRKLLALTVLCPCELNGGLSAEKLRIPLQTRLD